MRLRGGGVGRRRTCSAVALRTLALLALVGGAPAALSAPVEVYREGARYCPRDAAPGAAPIAEPQAIERARALLPDGFCGPSWGVAGCDFSVEHVYDSFRVYAHQYRERDGRHDWSGLTHTYVILDRVGNCLANIPGTELGAPN